MGAHTKILYNVMYGTTRDFMAPLISNVIKFPQVSVTYKAERSDPRQSRYADSEFSIDFLMKRCFVVVNDKNLSCKRV